jgi:hypothetical protein
MMPGACAESRGGGARRLTAIGANDIFQGKAQNRNVRELF